MEVGQAIRRGKVKSELGGSLGIDTIEWV